MENTLTYSSRYTFYVPSDAIRCTAVDGLSLECEGYFDRRTNTIRMDARDQDSHSWFWLQVSAGSVL